MWAAQTTRHCGHTVKCEPAPSSARAGPRGAGPGGHVRHAHSRTSLSTGRGPGPPWPGSSQGQPLPRPSLSVPGLLSCRQREGSPPSPGGGGLQQNPLRPPRRGATPQPRAHRGIPACSPSAPPPLPQAQAVCWGRGAVLKPQGDLQGPCAASSQPQGWGREPGRSFLSRQPGSRGARTPWMVLHLPAPGFSRKKMAREGKCYTPLAGRCPPAPQLRKGVFGPHAVAQTL